VGFLRSTKGKIKRDRIRNERIKENLKIKHLGNQTNNRMRWYRHVL
jgi:hypothetical protein